MIAGRVGVLWVASAVLLVAAAGLMSATGPGRSLSAVLVGLPQLAAAVAVAARSFAERGKPRLAWRLAALAILAYAWTSAFYIAVPGAAARFPGAADLSILTYPAMLAALVLFWRVRAPGAALWPQLDAGVAGLALAALGEWLLVAPHIGGSRVGLTTYGQVVYATGDMFLVGFALALGLVVEWPPAGAVLWAIAGFTSMAASDTVFAARVAGGDLVPSRFTELGWAAAMVVVAGAATTRPRRTVRHPLRLAQVLVPAAAAAIAVPVVIFWQPGDDPARLVIATAAVVLAGMRLVHNLAENLRLLRMARVAAARQETLAKLGRAALAGGDLEELFGDALRLCAEGLPTDFAAVLEYQEPGKTSIRASHGSHDPSDEGSTVLTAISTRATHRWWLSVAARESEGLRETERAFLEAVANVLAIAIDRLDAQRELRMLAEARRRLIVETLESEERERRRIAEGLHDLALQEVLAARQELDEVDSDGVPFVHRTRDGLLRTAAQLREIVSELHPVVLEHAGFGPALEAVARHHAQLGGFTYTLEVDDAAVRGHEDVLVSLSRELLANVARHAGASTVAITAVRADSGVALEICDDGCGVDPETITAAAGRGHIGLASWTERLEALGGTLAVRRGQGGGTRARAELPGI